MPEHRVEEGLSQGVAIGFAAQAIDHQRSMQGQRIEAAVEIVGNAAALEEIGRARLLGRALVDGSGKFLLRLPATKHDALLPIPCVPSG